ncbi:hypothetical protein OBBRIDRAFT_334222 [Obba rivulosa]|uniref:Uncharacterized protein n=1 Tax=Obba rivulosa TaxID=1052685 RepID=A0A8E2DJW3_9APHY|nr:hypothetical protein OBBRIDRAFT_334222 [Obba rivulosa]
MRGQLPLVAAVIKDPVGRGRITRWRRILRPSVPLSGEMAPMTSAQHRCAPRILRGFTRSLAEDRICTAHKQKGTVLGTVHARGVPASCDGGRSGGGGGGVQPLNQCLFRAPGSETESGRNVRASASWVLDATGSPELTANVGCGFVSPVSSPSPGPWRLVDIHGIMLSSGVATLEDSSARE